MLRVVAVLVLVVVVYAMAAFAATFFDRSIPVTSGADFPDDARDQDRPLGVMVWNVGYAGLGEASDFIADGGKMLLPPSRAAVEANLTQIGDILRGQDADIVMMQELAGPGLLTRGVDVLGGVRKALTGYSMFFSSDIHTQLMPPPLSLKHGLGFFSALKTAPITIHRLPNEPAPMMGLIHRQYHAQVAELTFAGRPWVFINIHLSAFDEGAGTRLSQLRAVLALGAEHHARGKAVVIGGDWNMMLVDTDFPHTSTEDALFWVHRLPESELPPGWKIAADPTIPTVRTNERPFAAGENFTAVIDGLIVSPNVDIVAVNGVDLGFRHSDHQPVRVDLVRND